MDPGNYLTEGLVLVERHISVPVSHLTPDDSKINSIPIGTTVSLWVNFFQPGNNVEAIAKITVIREDINMDWKNFTGDTKDSNDSADSVGVHRIDIDTHFNNLTELNFELWIKDGFDEVSKHTLTRGTYTDVTSFAAWYFESTYGTWLVSETNFCSSATDGVKCLRAYFEPNSTAINLKGKNITMTFRGTKTIGNLSQTDSLEFKVIGDSNSSLEWVTQEFWNY